MCNRRPAQELGWPGEPAHSSMSTLYVVGSPNGCGNSAQMRIAWGVTRVPATGAVEQASAYAIRFAATPATARSSSRRGD